MSVVEVIDLDADDDGGVPPSTAGNESGTRGAKRARADEPVARRSTELPALLRVDLPSVLALGDDEILSLIHI